VNGPTQTAGVRGFRGGLWASSSITLLSSVRLNIYTPDQTDLTVGFRVASIPGPDDIGDYNHNGVVDAADYVVWRKIPGTPAAYDTWRAHFGEPSGGGGAALSLVPEPSTLLLGGLAAVGILLRRRPLR
jgi:hypothetical protein